MCLTGATQSLQLIEYDGARAKASGSLLSCHLATKLVVCTYTSSSQAEPYIAGKYKPYVYSIYVRSVQPFIMMQWKHDIPAGFWTKHPHSINIQNLKIRDSIVGIPILQGYPHRPMITQVVYYPSELLAIWHWDAHNCIVATIRVSLSGRIHPHVYGKKILNSIIQGYRIHHHIQ